MLKSPALCLQLKCLYSSHAAATIMWLLCMKFRGLHKYTCKLQIHFLLKDERTTSFTCKTYLKELTYKMKASHV